MAEAGLWTARQVAEYLRVTDRTVSRMIDRGDLPGPCAMVGRYRRFDGEQVKAAVRGLKRGGKKRVNAEGERAS